MHPAGRHQSEGGRARRRRVPPLPSYDKEGGLCHAAATSITAHAQPLPPHPSVYSYVYLHLPEQLSKKCVTLKTLLSHYHWRLSGRDVAMEG